MDLRGSSRRLPWVLAATVLCTRLPFLGPGLGRDADAWRVGNAARAIAATGKYVASRFPGYPFQEIASSALVWGAPLALNLATAMMSALAAGCFAAVLQELGSRRVALSTLALALTPVIYVNSTVAMDYLWALAFILASLLWALRGRPIIAGVLLGCSIGCRITSGAMLAPLALLIWRRTRRRRKPALLLLAAASITGGLFFLPVVLAYGLRFLSFCEAGYRPFGAVLHAATIEIWGVLGVLGGVAALALGVTILLLRRRDDSIDRRVEPYRAVWVLTIALYLIAFLRLPADPAYLIPAVPFVLLLLDGMLDRRSFALAAAMLCAAPFATWEAGRPAPGALFRDLAGRRADIQVMQRQVAAFEHARSKQVVIAGPWLPMITWYTSGRPQTMVEYVYSLDRSAMQQYVDEGYRISYFPGERELNLRYRTVTCPGPFLPERTSTGVRTRE